jgi:tRNA(Ile)-lysidine synthase TilS/MesJ
MDTTDPIITFNDQGVCNHCTEYLNVRADYSYKGNETDKQFQSLVEKIKSDGKNRSYDCVVGLSGGVDSSYVAYLAKKNGLRVLGVHMDNGWNSEEAVQNIKNIAQILGIDYESYVLNWEEFKDIQLAFLKASIPEADTPTDIAILSSLHKVAKKYGVKPVVHLGQIYF